jgi:hypothetical protein
MRILGFSQDWSKLKQDRFTTFRFPRRDRDWEAGEAVQVVIKPRSKSRQVRGLAVIVYKESKYLVGPGVIRQVSDAEAREDGFNNFADMLLWFSKVHGDRIFREKLNKLIVEWQVI